MTVVKQEFCKRGHGPYPDRYNNRSCKQCVDGRYYDLQRLHTLRKYNMTVEEYNQLFSKQSGVCAICQTPETARNGNGTLRKLSIDHDHDTGGVRGLLCTRCNKALGVFNDNAALLDAASMYLKETGVT